MSPRSSQPDPPLRCAPLAALLPAWLALPDDRRAELIRRAEQLHDTMDPAGTFPVDYVAFRVTGYRRDYGDPSLLVGDAVKHDLRWVIDALGRVTPLPIDEDGSRAVDDWSMRLNVNSRTLRRWRDRGLRWRWLAPRGGGRRRIGHTVGAIEHFRDEHPELFEHAVGFSQIDDATRAELIEQARQIKSRQPGRSLSEVAQHLAEASGRGHETLRQLLEKHDQQDPDAAIFPDRRRPLTAQQTRHLARRHRAGASLATLAADSGRSTAIIHRALLDRRVRALRRLRLPFVDSALFHRPDAAEVFLRASPPAVPAEHPPSSPPEHWPAALRAVFAVPAPGPDALRSRFLTFNFLKSSAAELRDALPPKRELRTRDVAAVEQRVQQASRVKRHLIAAGLPELLSLARRQLPGHEPSGDAALVRLLLAGWPVLLAAVESYNASGNVPFHRYFRNRLLQRFAIVQEADPTPARQAQRRDTPERLAEALLGHVRDAGLLVTTLTISEASKPSP